MVDNSFVVIDVETANPDVSSICQIGLAKYCETNNELELYDFLVNPECQFRELNSKIHGITEERVANSPNFRLIYDELFQTIQPNIVVSYSDFDRNSFLAAAKKHRLYFEEMRWLDASRIVLSLWGDKFSTSYKLKDVAGAFNLSFNHHNAVEDARVTAELILLASAESNKNISYWFERYGEKISNKEMIGILANQEIVIDSYQITSPEWKFIKANGGIIKKDITYSTNMIIVDNKTQGSTKLKKAMKYNKGGASIRIFTSKEFKKEFIK